MLKKILIGFVALVAVWLGVAAFQPDDFQISRSIVIAAAPAAAFAQVNDFHRWADWSPWARLDPEMQFSFEGPPEGEGSVYRWRGNRKVGEGSMTLAKSEAPNRILIDLQFLQPMKDTSLTTFTFQPEGSGARVTWAMTGKRNFIGKAICLFMNMDKIIGSDFEKGLAQLKAVTEQPPHTEGAHS